jgi:hypothetical protein
MTKTVNVCEIKPMANLSEARLSGANLFRAGLSEANLSRADLYRANLYKANLYKANLFRANLSGANLYGANLSESNLYKADLSGANLSGARLSGADLSEADLRGARLSGADLSEADLSGAKLPYFQIPQEGEIIAFKKSSVGIVKLKIPAKAKRTATLVGRKCRAEFVTVLEAPLGAKSIHDSRIEYITGKTVYPDKYNDDIRLECTSGIHFFLTREEAEEY